MQYYYQGEASGFWREGNEQEVEYAQQQIVYGGRVDVGEKVLPEQRRKRRVANARFLVRFLLLLISTTIFLVSIAMILARASQPVVPNLTNVDLLLALVSYVGVNVIGNLLLSRRLAEIDRSKHITGRVIFAIISCLLVPVLCWMMIQGDNGADGVLLVLISAVVANGISYLALCKKRSQR